VIFDRFISGKTPKKSILIHMLLFFLCCAPKPIPAAEPPVLHERVINYTPLFNGRNPQSIYDKKVIDSALMNRVLVEEDILQSNLENIAIENWTRRLLFSELLGQQSTIIGPLNTVQKPCEEDDCRPTVALENLFFISSTENIEVVVHQNEDQLMVAIRDFDDQKSLCSSDLSLPIGFVEFGGAVQRYPDGALAAMIHEIVLLPDLDLTVVTINVDDSSSASLCRDIVSIYQNHQDLSRNSERYNHAARQVLEISLTPLYQKSP